MIPKIILDTNFIIYCTKNKIDYVEELSNLTNENFEVIVPVQVIEELNKITLKIKRKIPLLKRTPRFKKTTGKDKEAASLALQIIEKKLGNNEIKKISIIGKNVDEALIILAKENPRNIVCTLDKEMRKKLGRVILLNKEGRFILTR